MRVDSNASSIDIYRNYSTLNKLMSNATQRLYPGESKAPVVGSTTDTAASAGMTTRVRNINMAARSVQDASSLLSTADGAAARIQDVLQRMDGLAQQGTQLMDDPAQRRQIDAEYSNLTRQINDISKQTTYGGSSVLDGSLSVAGARRSAATEGIYVQTADRTPEAVMTQEISTEIRGVSGGPAANGRLDLGGLEIANARAGERITVNFGDQSVGASLKQGRNTAADIARSLLEAQNVSLQKNQAVSSSNVALDTTLGKNAAAQRAGEHITVNFGDPATGASLNAGRNTAADIARSILESRNISMAENEAVRGQNAALDKNLSSKAADSRAGEAITINFVDASVGDSLTRGTNTAADVARSIMEAEKVNYDGNAILESKNAVMQSENAVQIRLKFNEEQNSPSGARAAQQRMNEMNASISYTAADGGAPQGEMRNAQDVTFTSTAPGVDHGGQSIKINTVNFNMPLRVGDIFRMSGKVFELVVPGGMAKNQGASTISIFAAQTSGDVMQAMRRAMAAQFRNDFKIEGSGSEIKIEQQTPKSGDVALEMTPSQHSSTSVSFNMNNLRAGDQITLKVQSAQGASASNSYIYMRGDSAETMAATLTQGTNGVLADNSINFDDSSVSASFAPAQSAGRGVIVQGGGAAAELEVSAMNTAGLGLEGTALSSPANAQAAGVAVKSAMGVVSAQRSAMGAMQNQLQTRLYDVRRSSAVLAEQSARVDDKQAGDMLRATQQSIMQQMGAARSAQANTRSQNVLTLLM